MAFDIDKIVATAVQEASSGNTKHSPEALTALFKPRLKTFAEVITAHGLSNTRFSLSCEVEIVTAVLERGLQTWELYGPQRAKQRSLYAWFAEGSEAILRHYRVADERELFLNSPASTLSPESKRKYAKGILTCGDVLRDDPLSYLRSLL